MRSVKDIDSDYQRDVFSGLDSWIEDSYEASFEKYFSTQRYLVGRLSDKEKPITDDELQTILIDIPLKLFEVSEVLNKVKLRASTIKLNIKNLEKTRFDDLKTSGLSDTRKHEIAANSTLDDKFLLSAYESLIERVEKELSYSRELIMGAKKIWDGRRSSENGVPMAKDAQSDNIELPDYNPGRSPKSYIK